MVIDTSTSTSVCVCVCACVYVRSHAESLLYGTVHDVVEAHATALNCLGMLSTHVARTNNHETFQPRGSLSVAKLFCD